MKRNIAIAVGVVVLLVVVFMGYKLSNKKTEVVIKNEQVQKVITLTGSVNKVFEGDNILNYSFDIPESATSSLSDEGNLIKISDGKSTRATVYFSYEGGRGLAPSDYISEIVAPHVSVIDQTGTSTYGNYEWQLAETAGSNWYVASLNNGAWIVAVEAKKTFANESDKLVNSFKAE